MKLFKDTLKLAQYSTFFVFHLESCITQQGFESSSAKGTDDGRWQRSTERNYLSGQPPKLQRVIT